MTRTDLKPQNCKLQTRALCERYGVTTRTIDRWVETGVLPQPFRINRVRYWHEGDVEAFDQSRATAAASTAA
jgi:predicted DNA-binding transcriptional regulator AlpA